MRDSKKGKLREEVRKNNDVRVRKTSVSRINILKKKTEKVVDPPLKEKSCQRKPALSQFNRKVQHQAAKK